MPAALTVVIMAYNEVDSLESTYHEIARVLDDIEVAGEVIIVDDGSTDGTEMIADRLARQHPRVRVVRHSVNRGLGGVYRTGFDQARGDAVTFFPADGQFPGEIIRDFLPRLATHEMILGYLPRRKDSLVGRMLSMCERILLRLMLGPLPRFQGILMFRRALLGRYELKSTGRGWSILMEFVLRCYRDGRAVISVPTCVRPRAHGASKVNNWRTILSSVRQMLTLRRILREPTLDRDPARA